MKKAFLILSCLVALVFTCLTVCAKTNSLHTITLEKGNSGLNIVLNTDSIAKVARKTISDNEIVLEVSGITPSDTVNALYKGTDNIDNLVVENSGADKIKIYITAQGIKNSSVIMDTTDGTTSLVAETFPLNKAVWIGCVFALLGIIITKSVKRTKEEDKLLIKKDIKDREIALYRQYRRNFEEDTSLHSKDTKMKSILKKIDRKIDERLSMAGK